MNKDIFDAYQKDGWHIFELYKTKHGNGNAVKGMYATPFGWNDLDKAKVKYKPKAVYGGVPPEGMVCIDWDVKGGKKKGDVSFENLQVDLGVVLDTQVYTPSGGGHSYCWLSNMPDDTPKLKKIQNKYPDIDFQSHGSEFVVLGGQTVEGYGEYKFADEDFEYFVNEPTDFTSLELRANRERGDGYSHIDEDEHFMTRPRVEEVKEMLDNLDPNMGHDDGWQNVIMSLNSWDLNGDDGLQLAIEWSLKSTQYQMTEEQIELKYRSCVADAKEFYKKLFTLNKVAVEKASENSIKDLHDEITSAEDITTLDDIALRVQSIKMKTDERDSFIEALATASKDICGKPERVKWKKAVKFIDHEKAKERQEAAKNGMPDYVHTDKGVKYLSTFANLKFFLDNMSEHSFVYDPILKRVVVDNDYTIESKLTVSYSKLSDELTRIGVPSTILASHFDAVTMDAQHNGLIKHIEELPEWDGTTDYIGLVADTLTTKSATKEYKRAVIESFVIQAIAAWDGKERTPHRLSRLESVLTFVGKQGGGKTTWVGELMPDFMGYYFKDGVELDPSNKDSLIEATSAGLVELGELDATTRKSDIASLKAFLSNTQDEFRAPYGKFSERYLRQTVFVGTVNTPDFLKDATGSRRFMVLDVVDVKLPDKAIVEGLWAQAFKLYLDGVDWRLSDTHSKHRDTVNNGFTDVGVVGDVAEDFVKSIISAKGTKTRMTITRIAKELNLKLSARERSDFTSALARHGLERNNEGKYYLPADIFIEYRTNENIVDFDDLTTDEF